MLRNSVRNPAMLEVAIERGALRQSQMMAIAVELKIPPFVMPTPDVCAELEALEIKLLGRPARAHRPEGASITAEMDAAMECDRFELERLMAPSATEIAMAADLEAQHDAEMAETRRHLGCTDPPATTGPDGASTITRWHHGES